MTVTSLASCNSYSEQQKESIETFTVTAHTTPVL